MEQTELDSTLAQTLANLEKTGMTLVIGNKKLFFMVDAAMGGGHGVRYPIS